jgi:hypothetical protein
LTCNSCAENTSKTHVSLTENLVRKGL